MTIDTTKLRELAQKATPGTAHAALLSRVRLALLARGQTVVIEYS